MGTFRRNADALRSPSWPFLATLAAAFLMPADADGQTAAAWNGTNGNWSDAARWSTNPAFPDNAGPTTYAVTVGSGFVTLDRDITVQRLSLGGPAVIYGPDAGGPFTLRAESGIDFDYGATIAGPLILQNAGSTSMVGTTIGLYAGAKFANLPGATVTYNNAGISGTGSVDNRGAFVKPSPGIAWVDLAFSNGSGGTVEVRSGKLTLAGGGTHRGTFALAAGASLEFSGGHSFEAGAAFSGTGVAWANGGSFDVNTPLAIPSLRLSRGTLGGTGPLTAFLRLDGTAAISRDLTLAGGTVADGTADLGAGFTLTNPAGSTVLFSNGIIAGAGLVDNSGTLVVVTYDSTISARFNGRAGSVVESQAGSMRLSGGGTHRGKFIVAPLPALRFSGGHSFEAGTAFQGTGAVWAEGGAFDVNTPLTIPYLRLAAGTLGGSGALSAFLQLHGSGTIARDVTLAGGTVTGGSTTLAADATLRNPAGSTLAFGGGAIAGAGLLDNAGTISNEGSAGSLSARVDNRPGSAVLVTAGTLTIGGGGRHAGAFVVSPGASLILSGADAFDPGASFDVSSTGTVAFRGVHTFNGAAPFAGPGTVRFESASVTVHADLSIVAPALSDAGLAGPGSLTAADPTVAGTTTNSTNLLATGAGVGLIGAANLRNFGSVTLSPGPGGTAAVTQASGTGGAVSNYGVLRAGGGTVAVAVGLSNGVGGVLSAAPGATLSVDNSAGGFSNPGGSVAPAGGTVTFTAGTLALPDGTLGGFGSVPVAVTAAKTVSPTGPLAVGSLTMQPGSTFSPRIAGVGAGPSGSVAAAGDLFLAGTLAPAVTAEAVAGLAAGDAIPVASAGGTLYAALPVSDGGRIADAGGLGTFVVRFGPGSPYGAGNLVLTGWRTSAVRFAAEAFAADRTAGPALIGVTRTGGLNGTVRVGWSATAGTAVDGVDFAAGSGTLEFGPGETLKVVAIPVFNPAGAAADVTVDLALSAPAPAAADSPWTAVLTIRNPGGPATAFRFARAAYSTGKNQGNAVIEVRRFGDISAAGSVAWGISPLTAVPGVDYAPVSGTLGFAAGQASAWFAVPLLENPAPPGDVTVGLFLTAASAGSAVASPSAATLTITDTGGTYSRFAFSAAAYAADKDAGEVPVTIVRTGRTDFAATVGWSASPGNATDADFVPASGTLSFAPGETQRTFTVRTMDNPYAAGDVAVALSLGTASRGAGPAAPASATLTIRNATRFGPALRPVPRFRLFLPSAGIHLFTTDPNEYATLPLSGWVPEGVAHRVFAGPRTGAAVEAVAMWRLFDRTRRDHFWTTDAAEYAFLRSLPALFDDEGVDSYVYPSQVASTVPLYRLRFGDGSRHLWTTDANEYAVLAGLGWVQEGLVGFVLP
jgi:hypothetical protein